MLKSYCRVSSVAVDSRALSADALLEPYFIETQSTHKSFVMGISCWQLSMNSLYLQYMISAITL